MYLVFASFRPINLNYALSHSGTVFQVPGYCMQLQESLQQDRFGSFALSILAAVRVVSACEWEAVAALLLYTDPISAKRPL